MRDREGQMGSRVNQENAKNRALRFREGGGIPKGGIGSREKAGEEGEGRREEERGRERGGEGRRSRQVDAEDRGPSGRATNKRKIKGDGQRVPRGEPGIKGEWGLESGDIGIQQGGKG